ncbi:uncharacterized protein DS421_8g224920 [Arachis hypogaea]|nr:uncharacterized protein DS421_8g224920 [Arachis hypogaea]
MHLLRFVLSSARLYHVTAEMGILRFVLSLFFIYWKDWSSGISTKSMKRGWNIMNKPQELWVYVMLGKYGRGCSLLEGVRACSGDSSLCKNIVDIWPNF